MEVIFFWLSFSILVGWFAATRRQSGAGLFFVSIILSPLIGFLIVLIRGNKIVELEEADQRRAARDLQLETARALAPQANVADELRKFAELLKDGHISQDEFVAQKAKLLGTSPAPSAAPLAPPPEPEPIGPLEPREIMRFKKEANTYKTVGFDAQLATDKLIISGCPADDAATLVKQVYSGPFVAD